ncbi:MAG: hypothetical protein JKY26_01615 [Pseudomonas sp.]|nr:hypothetical protein [Pseudomonas sp.]
MNEEKKAYQANWNVKHNKTMFTPDSKKPLMLTKDEAAPLLALGAISELDEQPEHDNNDLTGELSQEQKLSAVIAAISTMDLNSKENTIGNGSPDAGKLTELVGFNVSASLRNDAWVEFNTAQALADAIKADSEQA